MKKRKLQIEAILLAGVIAFESVFAGIGSVNAQAVSVPQEEEVMAEKATIKYSGTDGKVNWSIDENGHLLLTGDGDYIGDSLYGIPEWIKYDSEIKTATVKVENMTNASNMFYYCDSISSLNLSNLDTSNVTNMSKMFYECANLTNVTFGGKFDTANVTDMSDMFRGCTSLTSLDLSSFDTGKVTNMTAMFYRCSQIKELDLSAWRLNVLESVNAMLNGMNRLAKITLPNTPKKIELSGDYYDDKNTLTSFAETSRGTVTYIRADYADSYCGKNGHTYCIPIFRWTSDYSSAQMYLECTREDCFYDVDNKSVLQNAVVSKEIVQSTYDKEGQIIYTAISVFDGKTYTDVKKVTLPKLVSKPVGTSFNTSNTHYRVTKAGKTPELAYMGPKNKKVKKVTIPATVKIDGITYKVTSVADGALKNYKNLTTVTIGANVTKIGKNAFYGCKKLGKIVIKSKKLKSVGKNAFKGIKKNATIDVPNSKKKAYKKLFKTKTGFKKTMKIK